MTRSMSTTLLRRIYLFFLFRLSVSVTTLESRARDRVTTFAFRIQTIGPITWPDRPILPQFKSSKSLSTRDSPLHNELCSCRYGIKGFGGA